jgi:translation initiation factor 2A
MPANARLFRYPDFETTIASRSFFQADRIDMKWNHRGTAVLLTASQDIDKTGKSYYGKSILYYLDTKGEAATVQTDSDAPVIHAAEWCPTSNEFCVITGKMPNTRAALFNNKCEVIFDMGISARNAVHFNPQGNLVVLGAFGNLGSGNVEVWEIRKLKKKIAQTQVAAVTQLLWLNDGIHFVTATTAPRMQVDNNFKVWDFGCQLVYEWNATKLFYGFQPFLSPTPPKFPDEKLEALVQKLGNKPIPRREDTQKAAAYVPVHLRKKAGAGALVPKGQPSQSKPESAQLTETEKKIKAARKKLDQIQKLKDQQKEGKVLEKNQLDKISTEAALIKEIQALELE